MKYDLCVITTEVPQMNRNHLGMTREAIAGGASVIQFREKQKSTRESFQIAAGLKRLTDQAGIPLIVNDRTDIALAVQAAGVHLGRDDMPPSVARKLLGVGRIIGVSASSLDEARRAEKEGADYLGVGPIFATPSKSDAGSPIGCKVLAKIRGEIALPLIAIGGITCDNLDEVIKAGADGVAVISAVALAPEMEKATARLVSKIKSLKEKRNDFS